MLCFSLAGFSSFAQQAATKPADPPKELPLISFGDGLTLFTGDVGRGSHTGGAFRSAWRFSVQQRFSSMLGAEIFGSTGMLSKSERSLTLNRNFQSPILFVGADAVFYFDNDFIMKRGAPFAPFLSAGFGWMSFDPHGDLKDANDSTYYYWNDGSIHDVAQNSPNASMSHIIKRDYTYETKLIDSTNNYKRSTFGIPLSAGFDFRFSPHLGAHVQATYFLTFTDYIDNVKSGGNDTWWWFGCSLYYKFGKNPPADVGTGNVDFNALMKEDSDGDGVPDDKDQCQGTPKDVKVDSHGCPIDSDNDGVPDYRDKEPNSKRGATVDADGVTIDFAKVAAKAREDSIQAVRDSVNEAQKAQFNTNPSLQTLQQGNNDVKAKGTFPDCIPAEFRAADKNKDCVITADEINAVIDDFFDGVGNWKADDINKLIDYFFDQ